MDLIFQLDWRAAMSKSKNKKQSPKNKKGSLAEKMNWGGKNKKKK